MADYRVLFLPSALKALEALPKGVQRRILAKLETLAVDPFPSGAKKLQGVEGLWRFRVGDYRVVYSVDGGELVVLVVRVGHRREIYR